MIKQLIKRCYFLMMPIEQRRSLWMRGLLYAEELGVQEATDQLYKHEFEDSCSDFDKGVGDYITHMNERNLPCYGSQSNHNG